MKMPIGRTLDRTAEAKPALLVAATYNNVIFVPKNVRVIDSDNGKAQYKIEMLEKRIIPKSKEVLC